MVEFEGVIILVPFVIMFLTAFMITKSCYILHILNYLLTSFVLCMLHIVASI